MEARHNEPRLRIFSMRLNDDESRTLRLLARAEGVRRAELIRRLVQREAERVVEEATRR
jgi:hypothetical protein